MTEDSVIKAARKAIGELEKIENFHRYTPMNLNQALHPVYELLDEADADVGENNDTKAGKTIAGLEARLEEFRIKALVCCARQRLERFEKGYTYSNFETNDIGIMRECVKEAGFEISVLDQTGESTVEEIEARLENGRRRQYLLNQLHLIDTLGEDKFPSPEALDDRLAEIEDLGRLAGHVVNPGPRLEEFLAQKPAKLKQGVEEAVRSNAPRLYAELRDNVGYMSVEQIDRAARNIRGFASKTDAGMAVLDEEGQATAEEMEKQLQGAAAYASIGSVSILVSDINSRDIPQSALPKSISLLRTHYARAISADRDGLEEEDKAAIAEAQDLIKRHIGLEILPR